MIDQQLGALKDNPSLLPYTRRVFGTMTGQLGCNSMALFRRLVEHSFSVVIIVAQACAWRWELDIVVAKLQLQKAIWSEMI
jgi:hypothetical protein